MVTSDGDSGLKPVVRFCVFLATRPWMDGWISPQDTKLAEFPVVASSRLFFRELCSFLSHWPYIIGSFLNGIFQPSIPVGPGFTSCV